jgi:coenzyme F420-reducing hydrogenase delta subunit/Pyruvate/2-oxoacid:ferredoxin oxidoreductase delta subunit
MDAVATRLYGWRYNPLHQSGAIAFALLILLILTGIYLLVFYRVSAPWASVQRLVADPILGRWMRSLHRFASDAMVVAALVHALRMFSHARSWGPRALAWVSGVSLLVLVFISGWTGFVIVWDSFGARLAIAGARLFDALPFLSEPVQRVFSGERPIPGAFFFINLFLHVAIPLGVAAGLWIHVSRVARPTLLPPKPLGIAILGGLFVFSVAFPAPLPPEANPFVMPESVPGDIIYAFWLPWVERLPIWMAWAGALVTLGIGLIVPRFTRRPRIDAWAPSVVDERVCTGCNQCPQDCPWEAIAMRPREDGRASLVAHVDPSLCVSCGVCAGSCAPMGVGPTGRSGRDQIADIRALVQGIVPDERGQIVSIMCQHAPLSHAAALTAAGSVVHHVSCTGNLHTSTIELAIRGGAGGVIVLSCPPRDCRGREGPKWLEQRVYHDREAELQLRVDRRRVKLATAAAGDLAGTVAAYEAFAQKVRSLGRTAPESIDAIDLECDREPATVAEAPR